MSGFCRGQSSLPRPSHALSEQSKHIPKSLRLPCSMLTVLGIYSTSSTLGLLCLFF